MKSRATIPQTWHADCPLIVGTHVCGDFGPVTCSIKPDGVYFNREKDHYVTATFRPLPKDGKQYVVEVKRGKIISVTHSTPGEKK